jgi:CBS domain-containing protein
MGSTVKDVMTTQVVGVGPTASFKEMVVKMRRSRASALPVVDGEGRVARGLVMAVRRIDGVVAVRDRLGYAGSAQ